MILARAPVEVVSKGQTAAQPLQKGARLNEGDRVRTGKGGAAEVVLGDGSLVRVGELSDLEIDKLDVDAANQPTTSRFNLAAGQARAWVARQVVAKVGTGTGRFAMQSPTAVAAVRQTDFALVHDAVSRVYTFAGVVETRSTTLRPRRRRVRTEPVHRREEAPLPDHPPARQASPPVPDGLAVEGVFLETNNLDNVAIGILNGKLSARRSPAHGRRHGPARISRSAGAGAGRGPRVTGGRRDRR